MIRSPLQTRGDLLASRLWQAALTYPQRWAFRISGGLLLITLAAIGCIAPVSELSRSIWGLIVIVQIAYGSTFITVHLKQQLDDWRSSITPNFRPTHFVVAGFILSLIVVGVPLLLCAPLGEHVKAFVAAAIVVAALCAWTVYDPLL